MAIDALARGRFPLGALLELAAGHRGDRGLLALRDAVALADCRSGSPMETRIRVAIHRYGLPPPWLQFPVGPFLLDLAYPDSIDRDGALSNVHATPRREAYDSPWLDILRLDAATVFSPRAVAIRVQRELVARGAASAAPVTARW